MFPFVASTQTGALTVGTSSTSAQLPLINPNTSASGRVQVMVTNIGTNVVFLNFGVGAATAGVPATGTPAYGQPLAPYSTQPFTVQDGAYIAAIAAATGNTVYFVVGEGF